MSSQLRSNTMWALAADGTQMVLTMISFFLLARFLGKEQFGIYGAAMAISALAAVIAYMGAQQLLMLDHSAGQPFGPLWGRLLSTIVTGGITASACLFLLQPLLLPELGRTEFACVAVSQIIFFGISEFSLVAAQAHRKMSAAFAMRLTSGSTRLVAVGLFIAAGEPTVEAWSYFALATWCLASLIALGWVRVFFGTWPSWNPPGKNTLRRGLPFVFGAGSATLLADADRILLVRLDTETGEAAAGIYNVGYRLASLAFVPVTALVRASDYDFYAAGAEGNGKAKQLAVSLTKVAAAYGAAAGVGIIAISFFVEDLLGDDYANTQVVLCLLAPVAFLKALQIFPANALTGSGNQAARNKALAIAVVLNLVGNAIMIPLYTWKGAIAATLLAEAAMAILLWFFLSKADDNTPGS